MSQPLKSGAAPATVAAEEETTGAADVHGISSKLNLSETQCAEIRRIVAQYATHGTSTTESDLQGMKAELGRVLTAPQREGITRSLAERAPSGTQ